MPDNIERGEDDLPLATEKELAAMEKLFASEKYHIMGSSGFLRATRKDLVSPDFIMNTLNDFVMHIHAFVAAARRMIPGAAKESFFAALRQQNPAAEGILRTALDVNLKLLGQMLGRLQASARNVSIAALQPFVKALYRSLIRLYYLTPDYATFCFGQIYRLVTERYVPSNPQGLRGDTMAAVQELKYIYSKVFPAMYPLVLRMASPVMLSEHDLFYKNGSKVLAWLEVKPEEILFPAKESSAPSSSAFSEGKGQALEKKKPKIPDSAFDGLDMLERLFPEAGWKKIPDFPSQKTDFAPYFAGIFPLSDSFIQLNPDHPLHFTMTVFQILSELFQGLRHVEFRAPDLDDGIYAILDDWIMYGVSVFDKAFGTDLKSYTHQVYSQPDFTRTPYAVKLMSNMYSVVRQYFLPFFHMNLYTFQKIPSERLPPLFPRVSRLREMLESSIQPKSRESAGSIEAANASEPYRFDIPNPVSRRLDALCGGSNSSRRTNKALISCCLSILSVLDWWINDKDSPAYKARPNLIYRTSGRESLMPAFGVAARADTEEIFRNSIRLTRTL